MIKETSLESWETFIEHINKNHSNCPAYIYRGQADYNWKIESSIDRMEKRFPNKKNYNGTIPKEFFCPPVDRETHFLAFKQSVLGKRGINPPELTEDEWWALAQHHGLATPLIDFTLSPFVALFFALEEEFCLNYEEKKLYSPEFRTVYTISSSKCLSLNPSKTNDAPYLFSPLKETSNRVISQTGIFIKMPDKKVLEEYPELFFEKIKIPCDEPNRRECLKFLNKMNINRMTLFPDLEGAAQYINSLWELDFDSSIGFLSKKPESEVIPRSL